MRVAQQAKATPQRSQRRGCQPRAWPGMGRARAARQMQAVGWGPDWSGAVRARPAVAKGPGIRAEVSGTRGKRAVTGRIVQLDAWSRGPVA